MSDASNLLDVRGLAEFLSVSESTADRLRREGLPALDVTPTNGGRPRKHAYRFHIPEVLAWLEARRENSGEGSQGST